MRWEREDAAYGAATLVAAALVAYFAIGNFGLVPSPLAPRGAGGVRSIDVPSLSVAGVRPTASVTVVPPVAAGTAVPAASPTPRPAAADHTPPTAEISTPGGTEVSATEPATVDGTADDAGAGVRDVTVTFTPDTGEPTVVTARVRCANTSRKSCQWSADVPGVAGTYHVTAVATDRASNKGHAGPTDVTVVNTGSVVGGGLTELLGGVAGALVGRR